MAVHGKNDVHSASDSLSAPRINGFNPSTHHDQVHFESDRSNIVEQSPIRVLSFDSDGEQVDDISLLVEDTNGADNTGDSTTFLKQVKHVYSLYYVYQHTL